MLAKVTLTLEIAPDGADACVKQLRELLQGYSSDLRITYEGRRAPVQTTQGYAPAGTVSWEVHEQAWVHYAACGHGSQSAEDIARRGGFGYRELQALLAGIYNKAEWPTDMPTPPTFEPKHVQSRRWG